jgi:hypothetical protein
MPSPRSDCRLLAWPREIIERRDRAMRECTLNAAPDRLMMHPQGVAHRKERRVFPIGQQHPRPLNTARRFRSQARYRNPLRQIICFDRQLNRMPPCCHDFRRRSANQKPQYKANSSQMNPAKMITSNESMN